MMRNTEAEVDRIENGRQRAAEILERFREEVEALAFCAMSDACEVGGVYWGESPREKARALAQAATKELYAECRQMPTPDIMRQYFDFGETK